jgi:hypothetical protein
MIKPTEKNALDKSYPGKMKRLFDNPMVEKLQTRTRRRLIVMAMITWFAALNALALNLPSAYWIWGPLFLLFFPLMSFLNMSVRGLTEIPISSLDDRQVSLRMKGYMQAYMMGLCLAFIFGVLFVKLNPDGLNFIPVFAAGLGLLLALPAMTLAWELPTETPEA